MWLQSALEKMGHFGTQKKKKGRMSIQFLEKNKHPVFV
tara:strand:+ start:2574 stop:2687 length:114 start_codon:yes stop_codon:yes gene_type:complete